MDNAENRWLTILEMPAGARCVYCKAGKAELQCERTCHSFFCEACYWAQAAPLRERVLRDFAAEPEDHTYVFICAACRS